jgi:hypothetical protein
MRFFVIAAAAGALMIGGYRQMAAKPVPIARTNATVWSFGRHLVRSDSQETHQERYFGAEIVSVQVP